MPEPPIRAIRWKRGKAPCWCVVRCMHGTMIDVSHRLAAGTRLPEPRVFLYEGPREAHALKARRVIPEKFSLALRHPGDCVHKE
jgi:hypothetical protein